MTQVAGDIATKGIAFCFWGAFPDVKEKALSYCLAQISAPHTLISYVYTCMSHVWTLISLRFYDCGSFQSLEWNWRECKSLSYWTLFQLPFWACQVVVCWPMFYPTFFGRNRFHVFHGRPRCTSSREGCVVLHKYFDVKASFQLNSNSKRILFHHISIQHYNALYSYHLKMGNPPYTGIWQSYQTNFHQLCVCVCAQISSFRQDLYDQQCLCKHMPPGAKSKAILWDVLSHELKWVDALHGSFASVQRGWAWNSKLFINTCHGMYEIEACFDLLTCNKHSSKRLW